MNTLNQMSAPIQFGLKVTTEKYNDKKAAEITEFFQTNFSDLPDTVEFTVRPDKNGMKITAHTSDAGVRTANLRETMQHPDALNTKIRQSVIDLGAALQKTSMAIASWNQS